MVGDVEGLVVVVAWPQEALSGEFVDGVENEGERLVLRLELVGRHVEQAREQGAAVAGGHVGVPAEPFLVSVRAGHAMRDVRRLAQCGGMGPALSKAALEKGPQQCAGFGRGGRQDCCGSWGHHGAGSRWWTAVSLLLRSGPARSERRPSRLPRLGNLFRTQSSSSSDGPPRPDEALRTVRPPGPPESGSPDE